MSVASEQPLDGLPEPRPRDDECAHQDARPVPDLEGHARSGRMRTTVRFVAVQERRGWRPERVPGPDHDSRDRDPREDP
jgi:hypothetical protein